MGVAAATEKMLNVLYVNTVELLNTQVKHTSHRACTGGDTDNMRNQLRIHRAVFTSRDKQLLDLFPNISHMEKTKKTKQGIHFIFACYRLNEILPNEKVLAMNK